MRTRIRWLLAVMLVVSGALPAAAAPITISGRVENVQGVHIGLCWVFVLDVNGRERYNDQADADGYYEITDVAAGTYKMHAYCHGDGQLGDFIPQYYGGVSDLEDGATLTVADDDLTVDFTMERYGRIRGDTYSADGSTLGIAYHFDLVDADTGELVSTASLSVYRMTFAAVEPGNYAILFYSRSGIVAEAWHFPQWYGGAPAYRPDLASIITVGDGEAVEDVDFLVEPLYLDILDSVFVDDIVWAQFAGITRGCASRAFCPDAPVTRGQMAAFLSRALGYVERGSVDFVDDDDSLFEADIERLATAGVTLGCNPPANDRFCPDDIVTRGQMAAFLVRALGYTDQGDADFDDDDGTVFEGDIEKLAAAGITTGCSETEFCPINPVTREQMTAFLHRALGGVLYPDSAGDRPSIATVPVP